jgi:putative ABC transport system ATP-binding protein
MSSYRRGPDYVAPCRDSKKDRKRHLAIAAPPAIVELEGVTKVFAAGGRTGVAAITDICLSIPAGRPTLITGPSGSGKTTLLSVIACMARPTSGRIRVEGREVTRMPEELLARLRRERFGFAFQAHHLIRGASALANVMLPALPRPEVNGDLKLNAMNLLARFRLGERARVRVERLSGGEQQRVAIARALINDPLVFIADEPTAHLDSRTAQSFLDVIRELAAEGKTIIVASHDPVLCESDFFARVLELRDGRLSARDSRCC